MKTEVGAARASLRLTFEDAVLDHVQAPEPYDMLLGGTARLRLQSGGVLVYHEELFPVAELALALEDWLRDDLSAGNDFVFDSVEHDEPGLVWCRSAVGGWRVGSIHADEADPVVHSSQEVAEAFGGFVETVRWWVRTSTGRPLDALRLSASGGIRDVEPVTDDTSRPLNLDMTRLEDGQLATLVRTVHEARFPDEEDDPVVWLSPFVIELHVAAIGEQRDRRLRSFAERASRGEDVEDEAERYEQSYAFWARWQGRRHEQAVVKRRIDSSVDTRRWFSRLTPDEVRPLFRPFEMNDASAEDLIAYARRSVGYEPEAAASADDVPRPYARPLTSVERPHGWVDVYEVAVRRPGSGVLSDHEATSRPEEVLRRRGFRERDARDCAQNAWKAVRTGFEGWCGVLPDDVVRDD